MALGPWDFSDGSDDPCHVTPWIYTMSGFLICFLSCMVLNEIYEMAQGLQRYFKNGLNYGWLLMIVTLTLNVLPVFVNFHGHWQYIVASVRKLVEQCQRGGQKVNVNMCTVLDPSLNIFLLPFPHAYV